MYSRSANSHNSAILGYDIKITNLADNTSKVYRYRKIGVKESFLRLPNYTNLRGKREMRLMDIPDIIVRDYLEAAFPDSERPSLKDISAMYYERLAVTAGVPVEIARMTCKIPYDDDAITILIALKSLRIHKLILAQKLMNMVIPGKRKKILEDFIGKDLSERLCMTDARKTEALIDYIVS